MVLLKSYIKNNIEYIIFAILLIILIYLLAKRSIDYFYTEQHGINRLDAIIYINLENREDRKTLLLKELETLNTNMSKVHKVSGLYIPKNGHKGCVQAHILAFNMIKLNNWKRVLILEDDAQLSITPDIFNNVINQTLDHLDSLDNYPLDNNNTNWDVIMLASANKILNDKITQYNKILKTPTPIQLEKIISATTSSAYIIKNTYVDKLLNLFTMCNNNMRPDKLSSNKHEPYALDQQWFNLQTQDNWYALSPDPIKQREIWSTILKESHA